MATEQHGKQPEMLSRQDQKHKHFLTWRIAIAIVVTILFTFCAVVGIWININSWSNILFIIFAIVSALIGLYQWFFPVTSHEFAHKAPHLYTTLADSSSASVEQNFSKQDTRKDFFISYSSVDHLWAEWLAWQLEEEDCSIVLHAWDSTEEANFASMMQEAHQQTQRIIIILPYDYLDTLSTNPEWLAAFDTLEKEKQSRPILVSVHQHKLESKGVLRSGTYIDLVGKNEPDARDKLLTDVHREHSQVRETSVVVQRSVTKHPRFP